MIMIFIKKNQDDMMKNRRNDQVTNLGLEGLLSQPCRHPGGEHFHLTLTSTQLRCWIKQ